MLLASNYFLLGDFFSRRISIDEIGARTVNLHRVNEFLHAWYTKKIFKEFDESEILILSKVKPEVISDNIKKLTDYYNSSVEIYDFSFNQVNKFTKSDHTSVKISLEQNFVHSKNSRNLIKNGIKGDLLLDSFSAYPVIPEDKEDEKINYQIFKSIYPRIHSNSEIIFISGELIWSGWLTMDIILYMLNENGLEDKIVIIDNWGMIQQLLSTHNFEKKYDIQTYDDLIDSFSTSIFITKKRLKTLNEVSRIISSNYSLYANLEYIKSFPSGVTHKPDYTFILSKKQKPLLNKTVIPLGIDGISPLTIPKSILGKAELTYTFPAGCVLQKYEGENVKMNEDIGLIPTYVNHVMRIKLPSQLTLKKKEGQYIKKSDVIAERAVLKNMLREKIVSPYSGYLRTNYLNQGIIQVQDMSEKKEYPSDFEGEILSIDKSETDQKAKIKATSFSLEIIYKFGSDAQGKLMRLNEVSNTNEDKILLVKDKELNDINSEFIINNNVRGVIVDSSDYSTIRKYIGKILKNSKITTMCLISPFSISTSSNLVDILFLYTGNSVIISKTKLNLLIDQQQSKQILLRLKSKDTQDRKDLLKKGEVVTFFNYSHSDPCARIENVSPPELILNTKNGIVLTSFNNIIKYTSTFYDTENK